MFYRRTPLEVALGQRVAALQSASGPGDRLPNVAAITPLDTCGAVRLTGDRYARVRDADRPLMRAVMDNYRIWARNVPQAAPETASTTLFDTVAVHLAFSTEYLVMERMGLRVTDDGYTIPGAAAREIDVAVEWADLDGLEEYLVERLVGRVVR